MSLLIPGPFEDLQLQVNEAPEKHIQINRNDHREYRVNIGDIEPAASRYSN